MEAALCPSDYVQTAEVSLASTVKNQSGICKRLTASAKKSMMHRAHYNASHEILKKFPNLQIQGKKKKDSYSPLLAKIREAKFQQMGASA